MKTYIGTKMIEAEPELKDGKEGYKVTYKDGYTSWSPKEAFEEAYRDCNNLSFGEAIYMLKKGYALQRKGWNGKGMWILMQTPDAHSKMSLPYLYIEYPVGHPAYPNGSRVPWLASQTDLLAEDWQVL